MHELKIACSVISFYILLLYLIPDSFFIHGIGNTQGSKSNMDVSLGVSSGDVNPNSVIIWSKTNKSSLMNIEWSLKSNFTDSVTNAIAVNETTDFAGHYKVKELSPDTIYHYKVWFSDPHNSSIVSEALVGKFKTAPLKNSEKTISFAVGGDLSGQGYCKRANIGFPIFTVIKELEPSFFVANGDMIYADDRCLQSGPSNITGWRNIPGSFPSVLDESVNWQNISELYDIYSDHWKYNKEDKHYQNLYSNIPIYSQADDHEIADNYDGASSFYKLSSKNRSGFSNLVETGLKAFFNFSPIEKNKDEFFRIYKEFHWGENLDIFLLDAHQYRTQANLPDNIENNKTLLGKPQFEWLKSSINRSNATWKAILIDVPVTIPHCTHSKEQGCDSWATDGKSAETFTRERNEFLKYLDDKDIKNIVFIVTDVHHPSNIVANKDFNGDGDKLIFHEFTSGPLSAIPLGPEPVDPTINATYLYKEGGFFNFGYYKIEKQKDNKVHFFSQVRTADGLIRGDSKIDLTPE